MIIKRRTFHFGLFGLALIIGLLVYASVSMASGYGDTYNTTNNYYDVSEFRITDSNDDYAQDLASGAVAMAQIDCYYGTTKWHGGAGLGFVGSSESLALGGCKKDGLNMYKLTATRAGHDNMVGIGIMRIFE